MGDTPASVGWPDDDEDDDADWVQLYTTKPDLVRIYLKELEDAPSPAALARFIDRCLRSLRCLRDLDAKLPELGLSLAAFGEIHRRAWAAQHEARLAEDDRDRPIADDETVKERRAATKGSDKRPPVYDVVADEMFEAVVNLHVRGLDDERIACALEIPREWPEMIISRAGLHAGARRAVKAHIEGKSLGQLAKISGMPASSALRLLRRIGEEPNGAKGRVDAGRRARTIVKLRARGLTYKEIASRVGCTMDDVKNALRYDRRHRYGGGRAAG